jgi:hypothetical protein
MAELAPDHMLLPAHVDGHQVIDRLAIDDPDPHARPESE